MISFLIPFLLVCTVMIGVKVAAKIRQRRLNSLLAQAEDFYAEAHETNVTHLSEAKMRKALRLTLTPEPPDSKN
jgi:hypothetical protein